MGVQTELDDETTSLDHHQPQDHHHHYHHHQLQQQEDDGDIQSSLVDELRIQLEQLRQSEDAVRTERDLISQTFVSLLVYCYAQNR